MDSAPGIPFSDDMDDRRRSRRALRRAAPKALLRLIAEQLPGHVWTTDADLRVTSVAGTAIPQAGIDPTEFIGKTVYELAGDAPASIRAHERALAGTPTGYEREFQGRLFEARVQPLLDAAGRVVGCLGLALDVTERRRTERRLAAEHAVGRVLLDSAGLKDAAPRLLEAIAETLDWDYGGLWTLDGPAGVLRCAATWPGEPAGASAFEALSRQMAFPPGEGLPGTVWASGAPRWVDDSANEAQFPRLQAALSEGLRSGFGVPIRVEGQVVGVLEFFSRRVRTPEPGLLDAMASLGSRIGQFMERKREQEAARASRLDAERLAELDRLRRRFISMVSHDLRTPLTAAGAGLGLLTTSLGGRLEPEEARLASTVGRNLQRLEALVDDLLALSRLEAGVLDLERQPLDLRAVVAEAVSTVQVPVEAKGQSLQVDLPEALPVDGDAEQLARVVINLLANAHRHTPPGTRIALAGHAVPGEIRLEVVDTGPGIPEPELERIFEPFHRVARAAGGSGLGLAIARGLVEVHGGRLWVESRSGHGATFHLALPARTGEGAGGGSAGTATQGLNERSAGAP